MAEDKTSLYWNNENPPLLLQGFPIQAISVPFITEDRKEFKIEVNRGVVVAIDYYAQTQSMLLGQDESFWNDAKIDAIAGGQDLLRDVPAMKFGYTYDIGNEVEQKIHTWLNGGQVIESVLKIDPASLSTDPTLGVQLQLYYSTANLERWRQSYKFKNGVGLKQRSYFGQHDMVANEEVIIEDLLPKSQGRPIGFSILYLSQNISDGTINLFVDGLQLIKDVNGVRFSRFWQRDPAVFLIPLNPGSTFKLQLLNPNPGALPGSIFIEWFFDN